MLRAVSDRQVFRRVFSLGRMLSLRRVLSRNRVPSWRCLAPLLMGTGLCLACGGRASVGEGDEDGFGGGGSQAPMGRSGAGGSRVPQTPRPDDPFGTSVLGECEPGFPEGTRNGRDCEYIHEGLCYEDQESACACACPSGNSRCIIGGFLSSDPLTVNCQVQ